MGNDGVPPEISVIVVNWNTRDFLRECLDSLRPVLASVRIEMVVIDNASTDGSQDMVRRDFPEAVLVSNTGNLGFAAANNQGIKLAKGKYLLLLNSDAVLLPGSLEQVWAAAEARPEAGMIGCRVLNTDHSLQVSCMRFPSLRGFLASALFLPKCFPKCGFPGYEDLTGWAHDEERDVEVLKGCFILARSGAVMEIGPLDESFWLFGEETDWCCRMSRAGWKVRFIPCAEIIHHGGESTKKLPGGYVHHLWGAKLQFVRKYRSRFYHALCCWAVGLWFAMRLPPSLAAAVVLRKNREYHIALARTCASGLKKMMSGGPAALRSEHARGPDAAA